MQQSRQAARMAGSISKNCDHKPANPKFREVRRPALETASLQRPGSRSPERSSAMLSWSARCWLHWSCCNSMLMVGASIRRCAPVALAIEERFAPTQNESKDQLVTDGVEGHGSAPSRHASQPVGNKDQDAWTKQYGQNASGRMSKGKTVEVDQVDGQARQGEQEEQTHQRHSHPARAIDQSCHTCRPVRCLAPDLSATGPARPAIAVPSSASAAEARPRAAKPCANCAARSGHARARGAPPRR